MDDWDFVLSRWWSRSPLFQVRWWDEDQYSDGWVEYHPTGFRNSSRRTERESDEETRNSRWTSSSSLSTLRITWRNEPVLSSRVKCDTTERLATSNKHSLDDSLAFLTHIDVMKGTTDFTARWHNPFLSLFSSLWHMSVHSSRQEMNHQEVATSRFIHQGEFESIHWSHSLRCVDHCERSVWHWRLQPRLEDRIRERRLLRAEAFHPSPRLKHRR